MAVDSANDVVAVGLAAEVVKVTAAVEGKSIAFKDDAAKPENGKWRSR